MGLNLDPWLRQLQITDKRGNTAYLDPNWTPAQRQVVDEVTAAYDENRPCRLIVLKARQLGISTISEGIGFSLATLFPRTSGFVVAHTAQSTMYLFDKIRYFYESWALRSHFPTRYSSRREMVFASNDSFIRVQTAKNPDALRGRTISFLHASEVAMWEKQEESMVAIRHAVPQAPGTVIILESCVTGDTLIPTEFGLVPIRSLVPYPNQAGHQPTSFKVPSRGGWATVESAYVNGVADTKCIETKNGYKVEATHIHPLLVLADGELIWKKAIDITLGDHLCIAYNQACFGSDEIDFTPTNRGGHTGNRERFIPERIDPDLAYLIGLYLAEGYASKKPVRTVISIGDEEVHDWLAETWGFVRKTQHQSWWFRRDFIDLLERLGLDVSRRAWEKTISDRLLCLSRQSQAALIQGMFDGDGTISKDRRVVAYVSTSRELVRRLQLMLLNFGVVSRLYSRSGADLAPSCIDGRAIQGVHDVHTLEITGPFYDTFLDEIGFRLKRKQDRRQVEETRGYPIPGMWKVLRGRLKGYGKKAALFKAAGMTECANASRYYGDGAMSSVMFNRLIDAGAEMDPEIGDYYYDPVVSIEDARAETFDLTVPETSAFIANGIMSHNTANGVGNWFHDAWREAEAGENDFVPLFFPWFTHHEYIPCFGNRCKDGTCDVCQKAVAGFKVKDEEEKRLVSLGTDLPHLAWRRWALPNLAFNSDDYFRQEMPSTAEEAFLTSGVMVFPQSWLDRVFERAKPAVGRLNPAGDFLLDHYGPLKVYKPPSKDAAWGQYFIGADPAYGKISGDFAAAHVINRQTKEQVAVWHGRIGPMAFADELIKLAKWYNDAVIACEVNGPGQATIARLTTLGYPRLWHQRLMDRVPGKQRSEVMVGWSSDWRKKQWMVMQLVDAVERGDIVIHDRNTYAEMRSYSFYGDSGDMFGPSGKTTSDRYIAAEHDDLVMSLGIAIVAERVESPVMPYETRPGVRGPGSEIVYGETVDVDELVGGWG